MKTNEKDTKQRVVPALRFPEFSDMQEWEEIPMHQIGKTLTGLSGKNSSDFGYGNRYITYKQVYSDTVNDFDKCEKVFVNKSEKQNCVQQGDVLFTTSSETPDEVGISSVILKPLPETIYLNSFCFILRPYDINNLYTQFAKHLFQSPIYRKRINKLAQGAIRFNLSKAQFINLSLPIAVSLKEQQKIADCLSSIDALIKATENKIDELKTHKKGLMQQLFPAEGKMVPTLRFPEFQNAGEWKPYKLNDFGSFFRGLTYSTADVSNNNEGIGVLRSTNIQNNRLILDKDLVFVNKTCSSEQRLQKGDIVICMSNGSKTLVGKNAELDQDISYDLTVGAFCSIFRPKNVFAKYLLQTDSYTKFVALAIGGGNINNLKNSDLENFVQFAPTKPEEQKKIADCLSSVDDLIMAQTNRLEAFKAHKKGLMQQLFPNIDEC